jgi:uncharacterized protein (TIGR00369 family)
MQGANEDGRRYLPTGDTCFVCGADNPGGLQVRFYTYGDGQVHVDFTPAEHFTGYTGVVHGGIIGTVLDEILGWAISLQSDRFTMTAELTVRYVKSLASEQPYHAVSRVAENRGRYWVAEGEMRDAAGTVYARGRGKYFALSVEETRQVAAMLTYQPGDLPIFKDLGE